jgi:hypothetical protein
MFVNGKHETFSDFYHGNELFADKDGFYEPPYTGVDTLMLYTLTPGVTSSFKDIKICSKWCKPSDEEMEKNSARGRYGGNKIHMMLCVIINILIITLCREINRY